MIGADLVERIDRAIGELTNAETDVLSLPAGSNYLF